MHSARHVYKFNKQTVLNVLYDTIDAIGLVLIHANSKRGTLIVSMHDESSEKIRIAVESEEDGKNTHVQLFSDTGFPIEGTWEKVFFNEVDATIKQSLQKTGRWKSN